VTLPPLVQRYLERALPEGADQVESVHLTQEGTMHMKPGSPGMRFTATEHFEATRVAFTWRARFRPLRLPLHVVDAYDAGRGLLELRLGRLRVRRQQGPELALGESLRYLAELPWVPHALVRNSQLEWAETGEWTVEVAAEVAGARPAVTFEFDGAGDIVRASALRRRQEGKAWVETPWGGDFEEYAVVDGVRLPTSARVYWEHHEDRFVYWRGRVLSVSAR
jgi:hypothetical protein